MRKLLAITVFAMAALTVSIVASEDTDRIVVKMPFGQHQNKGQSSKATQILYNGGPVLLGTVPIYVVYYGTGFENDTQTIVNNFLGGLNRTPQWSVNSTYCNVNTTACPGSGTSISNLLGFQVDTTHIFYDSGSQGTMVKSSTLQKILQHALDPAVATHLPADNNAMYIVMTDPTMKVPGFCASFCAYHTHSSSIASGHNIRYAFVPDPGTKCNACDGNIAMHETSTPTGNIGADEMVDSIMHELSETVTDPDISAWYTSGGAENGDLCNYNYGTGLSKTGGASYNAEWGGYKYLIQLI